jgi:Spy/CpxP family protein refolding chaperone
LRTQVVYFKLEQVMKIRSALAALILALVALPAARAQDAAPGQGQSPGDRRMQMMFKDITLSPVQKAKVDSVVAHFRTQMGPMTPGTRPDSATMATRRSLMQKQHTEIRALLTPEQQPLFDRNVEEMRNSMRRQDH